jgi:AraC-like DNA-binding protein
MTGVQMRGTPAFQRTILLFTGGRFGEYESIDGYRVERVQRWGELLQRLPPIPPSTVLVLEPYADGGNAPPEFWDVLGRFPSLSVIAAVPLPRVSNVELRKMQMGGVSEFLNLRLAHSPALVARVADNAFARPLKRRVDAGLSRFLMGDARVLIRGAAEVATCAGSAEGLAKAFGVSPPTVTKWCEALRLPPPRRLQLWLRLALAAQLMEDVGRSIPQAARAAGYATDRSFRRALQDLVGENPRDLRAQGAFPRVMTAFNADLREFRGQRRRPPGSASRVLVPISAG